MRRGARQGDPLKVGLDLTFLGEQAGGVGRYAVELAAALASRDDVVVDVVASRSCPPPVRDRLRDDGVRWSVIPVRAEHGRLLLLADFVLVPLLALARQWDIVHSPANAGPVRIPGAASVVTMHDTIWLDQPEEWGSPAAVRAMHRVAVPTARRATRVITVSETAADDLVRGLGLDRDRIDVAPHGVAVPAVVSDAVKTATRRRFSLADDPVVLCVAQKRPYKNQEALVRAAAALRHLHARFVFVGAPTDYEQVVRERAAAEGVEDDMRFVGWLGSAELDHLYACADVVALPTRREGFGLPVLEAMSHGVPVVCSDLPVLREVAGDDAVFFPPDDVPALATALERVLTDAALRRDLVERGRRRAVGATWEATAEATVAAYRRAVTRREG